MWSGAGYLNLLSVSVSVNLNKTMAYLSRYLSELNEKVYYKMLHKESSTSEHSNMCDTLSFIITTISEYTKV